MFRGEITSAVRNSRLTTSRELRPPSKNNSAHSQADDNKTTQTPKVSQNLLQQRRYITTFFTALLRFYCFVIVRADEVCEESLYSDQFISSAEQISVRLFLREDLQEFYSLFIHHSMDAITLDVLHARTVFGSRDFSGFLDN